MSKVVIIGQVSPTLRKQLEQAAQEIGVSLELGERLPENMKIAEPLTMPDYDPRQAPSFDDFYSDSGKKHRGKHKGRRAGAFGQSKHY